MRQIHLNKLVTLVLLNIAFCTASADARAERESLSAIHGIWELSGYGNIYRIHSDGTGAFYEFTRKTCISPKKITRNSVARLFGGAIISADNRHAKVRILGKQAAFVSHLTRRSKLPLQCTDGQLITDKSPTSAFSHFWHTLNDYYAFFEERSVSWDKAYARFAPRVNNAMSDSELFTQLCALVQPLRDGHVEIESADESCTPVHVTARQQEIVTKFSTQNRIRDMNRYRQVLAKRHRAIRNTYLIEQSIRGSHGDEDDPVSWGMIPGNIGYLRVGQMSEMDPDKDDADLADDVNAIHSAMHDAMGYFRETAGLVIDVRDNGGGFDEVGFAIASYFTERRRLVLSKWARSYQGTTKPVHLYLEPATRRPYLKPVVVIAGPESASAAETFLLSMSALPQVTLVGENSNGILSDELSKALPNGWSFKLSNEVYVDNRSRQFEVVGVPPQVRAATFSIDAIENRFDPAIESAIRIVRGQ